MIDRLSKNLASQPNAVLTLGLLAYAVFFGFVALLPDALTLKALVLAYAIL